MTTAGFRDATGLAGRASQARQLVEQAEQAMTSAGHRYIREAVEVLAGLAPTLAEVMHNSRTKAFVV
ncbi:hypothetical protein [Streptomyces sp. NPDC058092]|uniref:hypothetical protein n=1 Tax=Streptomyces sp. NPDC058092 TaxID=3346336 RepID=UPI0036E4CFCF